MFAAYEIVVRVFPLMLEAGYCRHQFRASSATPMWTSAREGSWVQEAMTNSQLPAVGVPDPAPTLYVESSWTTQDCSEEVRVVKVVP